jgi:hypothetical protein
VLHFPHLCTYSDNDESMTKTRETSSLQECGHSVRKTASVIHERPKKVGSWCCLVRWFIAWLVGRYLMMTSVSRLYRVETNKSCFKVGGIMVGVAQGCAHKQVSSSSVLRTSPHSSFSTEADKRFHTFQPTEFIYIKVQIGPLM